MARRKWSLQRPVYGHPLAVAIGLLVLVQVAAGCAPATTAPGAPAPAQTQPTSPAAPAAGISPAPSAAASAMPEATTTSAAAAMTPAASASASAMPEASTTPAAGASSAPVASLENVTGTPTGPALVKVGQNDTLGQFLVDARGMSLYLYTKDTKNTSNCYDKCAEAWPPLYTNGAPQAGDGANASLLGTTQRKDGTTQVTYNGYPLYYWFKDKQPGDVSGQDVGKVWYVISPAGEEITTPLAQPTAAAGTAGTAVATLAATTTAAGAAAATPVSTAAASGRGAGGGQTVNVTIKDFKFGDSPLTIPAGTTVVWTNTDAAPHTVTADDGSFDSGNLNTGDKFQFTFKTPGTYPYYCTYHGGKGGSGMASKVIVQ